VSFAPWNDGFVWRAVYRSSDNGGTVYYKSIVDKLADFYSANATPVSEYKPNDASRIVVGSHREIQGSAYWGDCMYVGHDYMNVYFDAYDVPTDVRSDGTVPAARVLEQNYPNPFNPATTIRFTVGGVAALSGAFPSGVEGPADSRVRLSVYDLLGREVTMLVDEQKQPGEYTATWDARGMASGVYFYRLIAGNACETKRMLLIR
jgi:hypothetical protein